MYIRSFELKNFRCFKEASYTIESSLILLQGPNGSGKSSLLEALYYASYLRSSRTHLPKELIKLQADSFFIRLMVTGNEQAVHELTVGFSPPQRLVKIDQKKISSYKYLFNYYRTISIAEDELMLIKGSPELRRSFIDGALLLGNPEIAKTLSRYRAVLEQRNAFLKNGAFDPLSYKVWTEQLLALSYNIFQERIKLLARLERHTNTLITTYLGDRYRLRCVYEPKYPLDSPTNFETFQQTYERLETDERRCGRTLFGVHLDDIILEFDDQHARSYASRGQQKLIVILLKVAQLLDLKDRSATAIFLLDDFMTDFDEEKISLIFPLLMSLKTQLFFTSPTKNSYLTDLIRGKGQIITL